MTDKPHQGWQCPVCKRVMAPWVKECDGIHYEVGTATEWHYYPLRNPPTTALPKTAYCRGDRE
jgi:hypothetical protein